MPKGSGLCLVPGQQVASQPTQLACWGLNQDRQDKGQRPVEGGSMRMAEGLEIGSLCYPFLSSGVS